MIKKIKTWLIIAIVMSVDFIYNLFGYYDTIENLVKKDIPEKSDPVAELGMAIIRQHYKSKWGKKVLMLSVSRDIIGLLNKELKKRNREEDLQITTNPSNLRENAELVFKELMPLYADQGEDENVDRIRILEWITLKLLS